MECLLGNEVLVRTLTFETDAEAKRFVRGLDLERLARPLRTGRTVKVHAHHWASETVAAMVDVLMGEFDG